MRIVLRTAVAALAIAALGAALPGTARASGSTPALLAFDRTFSGVHDYTYRLRAHEVKGSATQDRVYQYSFMKPHFAKTLILSGDGQGSGGVWAGGDQVSGHQGGFLAGIHLKVGLHDSRATSLRGYTIPDGLLQNIVAKYQTIPGQLSQGPGGDIGGTPTTRVVLKVADPAANSGVTMMILYLSQKTKFPVREIWYKGSRSILDQSFLDLHTNVGLTQNDFPF
ncbi:MAG TPA: hypothetical protein VMV73_00595 [Candidatus Dormibacteraeota bacterium]|nr:hypothetical protein [Candidatus Dormibacteraeota bacterium]